MYPHNSSFFVSNFQLSNDEELSNNYPCKKQIINDGKVPIYLNKKVKIPEDLPAGEYDLNEAQKYEKNMFDLELNEKAFELGRIKKIDEKFKQIFKEEGEEKNDEKILSKINDNLFEDIFGENKEGDPLDIEQNDLNELLKEEELKPIKEESNFDDLIYGDIQINKEKEEQLKKDNSYIKVNKNEKIFNITKKKIREICDKNISKFVVNKQFNEEERQQNIKMKIEENKRKLDNLIQSNEYKKLFQPKQYDLDEDFYEENKNLLVNDEEVEEENSLMKTVDKKNNFDIVASNLFFTYPQCDLSNQIIMDFFVNFNYSKNKEIKPILIIVCEENHKNTEGIHHHIYLELSKRIHIRNPSSFDIKIGNLNYHPNIQKVKRKLATIKYVCGLTKDKINDPHNVISYGIDLSEKIKSVQ